MRKGARARRRTVKCNRARHTVGYFAATVDVRTPEAMEALAVCLHHKEKLILESHTPSNVLPCQKPHAVASDDALPPFIAKYSVVMLYNIMLTARQTTRDASHQRGGA